MVEVTSKSTKREDLNKKKTLYQDVLKVKEYILFDPFGDYLKPRLQGYRLHKGAYDPILLVDGRLPSKVLDLQFEPDGTDLRVYDPHTGGWLATPTERAQRAEERADHLEEELTRLRQELKNLQDHGTKQGDSHA